VDKQIGTHTECKDCYEQTIQQSKKTETTLATDQAEKDGGQRHPQKIRVRRDRRLKPPFKLQSRPSRAAFFVNRISPD
jgi:hypothetical protein